MAAVTVTGKVFKCEQKQRTDPDYNYMGRYSPNTERYQVYLNVGMVTDDGKRYFFDTPPIGMRVANCPVAAIVTYDLDGSGGTFFTYKDGSGVATAEKANENGVTPNVKLDDTITVRGSIKYTKPGYTCLNRVKLVK